MVRYFWYARAMKYATLTDTTYALRLERAEDIHSVVQQFCATHSIANAAIEGIGSVRSPTLAHYSIETKHFTNKQFDGIYEVASLLGNLSLVDGQPLAHLHATISDAKMRTFGGHLVTGECSATLEILIHAYPSSYTKSHSEAIGLIVWDF